VCACVCVHVCVYVYAVVCVCMCAGSVSVQMCTITHAHVYIHACKYEGKAHICAYNRTYLAIVIKHLQVHTYINACTHTCKYTTLPLPLEGLLPAALLGRS